VHVVQSNCISQWCMIIVLHDKRQLQIKSLSFSLLSSIPPNNRSNHYLSLSIHNISKKQLTSSKQPNSVQYHSPIYHSINEINLFSDSRQSIRQLFGTLFSTRPNGFVVRESFLSQGLWFGWFFECCSNGGGGFGYVLCLMVEWKENYDVRMNTVKKKWYAPPDGKRLVVGLIQIGNCNPPPLPSRKT